MLSSSIPIIFILGVKKRFRGKSLVSEINRQSGNCQIHWAKTIEEVQDSVLSSIAFQYFTIGRELKFEEISCALGHNDIYMTILSQNLPWAIVLEDDVQVVAELVKLNDYLFESDAPSIIFLNSFSQKLSHNNSNTRREFGVSAKLSKQFLPKNIACSYAINLAAVRLIANIGQTKLISVADWPYLWFSKVSFYQISNPFFLHSGDPQFSLIGSRVNSRERFSKRIPNPMRVIRAILFGVSIKTAFKNELVLKTKLIYLQAKFKLGVR
jgi:GR25 family glycosyltransferase involved in LPS biosynthesis